MLSKEEYSRAKLDKDSLQKSETEDIYVISFPKTQIQNSIIRSTEFTARG